MVQVVGEKMAGYSLADVVRLWGFQGRPPLNHVDSVDKKKSGEANKIYTDTKTGGFKYVLFSSLLGEMIQYDSYCSNGLVQPPTRRCDFKRVLTLPSCLWWDKSWWQRIIVWWWVRCLCSWKFLPWTRSRESVFVNNFILEVVAIGDETMFNCLNLFQSQSQDPTKTQKKQTLTDRIQN